MTIPNSVLNSKQTGLSLLIYILCDTLICRRQPERKKEENVPPKGDGY